MKRTELAITFIVVFFFTFLNASAQNVKDFTGSLLWKVSGNGLSKPSYILGTHHLMEINFIDSINGLKPAMENTRQTVGELVLDDQAAMQTKMQQSAQMPAGESYQDMLTAEEYSQLDKGLTSVIGVGLQHLGKLKPGMISMLYTITLYTKLYPKYNPMSHEAIDIYVQRIAKENNKPVLGLETIEDQIYALFDAEPQRDQAKALACVVANSDDAKDQLDKLNEFYRKFDLMGMYDLSFNNKDEKCPLSQTQQNALVRDRNNKWVEKLPGIMKSNPSFVAVGALHLPGEHGILYQLAKLGYKVEPVR